MSYKDQPQDHLVRVLHPGGSYVVTVTAYGPFGALHAVLVSEGGHDVEYVGLA